MSRLDLNNYEILLTVIIFMNDSRTDYIVSGLFSEYEDAEQHISDLKSKIYSNPNFTYEVSTVFLKKITTRTNK